MAPNNVFLASAFATLVGLATASTSQCTASERSVWFNSRQFSDEFESCSRKNMGVVLDTAVCLEPSFGSSVSRTCLTCFGYAAQCGAKNCAFKCMHDSGSQDCLTCISEHCTAGLKTCVGASQDSELPLAPVSKPPAPKPVRPIRVRTQPGAQPAQPAPAAATVVAPAVVPAPAAPVVVVVPATTTTTTAAPTTTKTTTTTTARVIEPKEAPKPKKTPIVVIPATSTTTTDVPNAPATTTTNVGTTTNIVAEASTVPEAVVEAITQEPTTTTANAIVADVQENVADRSATTKAVSALVILASILLVIM